MKLNEKGFAISGVLYSLLILFVTLFLGVLTILASTKFSLNKIKVDVKNKLENLTYRDTILNGADPVLKTGMIPVTIEADGTVRKTDTTQKWYDYDTKTWADAVTDSSNSSCLNSYGTKTDNIYNQSTTVNISGIFDMSGGVYEYVMGYTTGTSTAYGLSDFTTETFPKDKYVDIYTSSKHTDYSKRILGDAT